MIPALIARKDHFDVALVSYNFTMDPSTQGLLESAAKAGLGVVAMKVMAGGLRRAKPGDKNYETFKREGALYAALKWVLRNPNVATTIPSITDMDQLDENMRAMTESFSDIRRETACRAARVPPSAVLQDVRRVQRNVPERPARSPTCCAISSMPRGTANSGWVAKASWRLPEEVRQVRCNLCPACSVACPNGVRVSERLIRAQEVFA